MSDRLTRKEMKRDEVMEGLSRIAEFIGDNLKALGLGLAAVLALIAGFAVWQAVEAGREEKANESLAQALEVLAENDGDLTAAREGLEGVASQYGATKAGSIAHAYLGTIAAQGGDFTAARAAWERSLARHRGDALAAGVERNLIAVDRAEGKSEELAARLRAALANDSSALGTDSVLFELARTLEDLGQAEVARETYARLLEEHPTSVHTADARERQSALEVS